MNPLSTPNPSLSSAVASTQSIAARRFKVHYLEALNELRRTLRMPAFVLPSLLFPWMFYLFFGVLFNRGNSAAASYLLVSYACFGVIGPALFGFGMAVAVERERGLLALKRALPMPISAYFCAKIFMSLVFASIILIGLWLIASLFAGVRLPWTQVLGLNALLLLGVLPFCALGLAIGLRVNATAAPAVVNLIYLPMAFLSGLWIPIQLLPELLQQAAWFLPPYHLSQLALGLIGQSQGYSPLWHLGALFLFSGILLSFARSAYRRIDGR